MYIYIYIYIYTHTHTHMHTNACMHACMRACVRACVRACMFLTYIHNMYLCTHMHSQEDTFHKIHFSIWLEERIHA